MNTSQKCNCCVCEPVCKWKDVYQNGVEAIKNTNIQNTGTDAFWRLRDCPHIEVSIRCPHIITRSMVGGGADNG